jgi:hypothetical protein
VNGVRTVVNEVAVKDLLILEQEVEREVFLDMSALVKYYHPEEGTGAVTQFVQERNGRHYISRLGIVESQHAFAIKLRTGEITETDFVSLRQRLLRDIAQGQLSTPR